LAREKFLPKLEHRVFVQRGTVNGSGVPDRATLKRFESEPLISHFTREDRRQIYAIIYPEYQKRSRKKRSFTVKPKPPSTDSEVMTRMRACGEPGFFKADTSSQTVNCYENVIEETRFFERDRKQRPLSKLG
jgi:hypothetical protein